MREEFSIESTIIKGLFLDCQALSFLCKGKEAKYVE